jgi:hypothetical protein
MTSLDDFLGTLGYAQVNPLYAGVKGYLCCGLADIVFLQWAASLGCVCAALVGLWAALGVLRKLDALAGEGQGVWAAGGKWKETGGCEWMIGSVGWGRPRIGRVQLGWSWVEMVGGALTCCTHLLADTRLTSCPIPLLRAHSRTHSMWPAAPTALHAPGNPPIDRCCLPAPPSCASCATCRRGLLRRHLLQPRRLLRCAAAPRHLRAWRCLWRQRGWQQHPHGLHQLGHRGAVRQGGQGRRQSSAQGRGGGGCLLWYPGALLCLSRDGGTGDGIRCICSCAGRLAADDAAAAAAPGAGLPGLLRNPSRTCHGGWVVTRGVTRTQHQPLCRHADALCRAASRPHGGLRRAAFSHRDGRWWWSPPHQQPGP